MKLFKDFPLSPSIAKALDSMGFTNPTEIQEKSIPLLLEHDKIDFHGQAQTGTGKTLAFGIPLLQKIDVNNSKPQALIVAPTRELVLQICDSLRLAAQFMNVSIEAIYGGVSILNQIRALKNGVQVVVGTPGRLRDHLRRKTLSLKSLHIFVLDEADIMLDMGFKEEIDEILEHAPEDRQIWLFSATVKGGIAAIKNSHMKDPVSVRVSQTKVTTSNTKQFYCMVPMRYRLQALCRVIDTASEFYGLIFCQTKVLTGDIAERLVKMGYRVSCLHGDMDQKMRNKVIKKFKEKSFDIVVATDVAARGIDVAGLTHVINYSFPEDQESYVHRIGRTGRAGNQGTAITFINNRELRLVQQLARRFNTEIHQLEIPTVENVIQVRVDKALSYFNDASSKSSGESDTLALLRTTVSDSTKEQLVDGVINMLKEKFLGSHDKEQDIPSVCPTEKALQDGDKRELMLHVGFDDGIDRETILKYCLDAAVVEPADIERVRVIKRRSFVILPSDSAAKLVKALKGKRMQGKRVRISLVSQDEPRGDGGGDRDFSSRRNNNSNRGGSGRRRFSNNNNNNNRRRANNSWR